MQGGKYPNFDGIEYFRPKSADSWGKPEMISRELLEKLDYFRKLVGLPTYVTSGWRDSIGSQHRLGRAADIVVPKWEGYLYTLYGYAVQAGFTGIGIYPHWTFGGLKVGGLHVDVRVGKPAEWMGVLENGKQIYIALTQENLKKYGVIP